MLPIKRLLLVLVAQSMLVSLAGDLRAQGVNNMTSPAGPAPVPGLTLNLPPAQVTFDSTLNPMGNLPGGPLSPQAQQILQSHNYARQQVRLALQYLLTHEQQILAGQDELFNRFFGRFYDTNPATNPFLGQYQQTDRFNLIDPRPLISIESAGGGNQNNNNNNNQGGQQGNNNAQNAPTDIEILLASASAGDNVVSVTGGGGTGFPVVPRLLQPGMKIFLGDISNVASGEIHTVLSITDDAEFTTVRPFLMDLDEVPIHRVIDVQDRPLRGHYQQVVSTFMMIRALLDQPVTYRGNFDDMETAASTLFAPGNATFPGLNQLLGHPLDRGFRQAGYSTSNSQKNIDIFNLLMDPENDTTPLFWTEDNDLEDGRPFFNNQMTIFGVFDDTNPFFGPIDMFVGPAFLEERLGFAGDALDREPAVFGLEFDPVTGEAIPGTGTPQVSSTPLQQWQMIISAFAESSSDLTQQGVAAFGLGEILESLFPEGSPQFLESQAAENFAEFAALFQDPSVGGSITADMFEPPGKRGNSLFFPIVPDTAFFFAPTP